MISSMTLRVCALLATFMFAASAHAQGTPPPVVGSLSVTNIMQTSVRLNAQVTTNNASSTQVFFEYQKVGTTIWQNGGNTTIGGSTQPSTASVNLGGLVCNTAYQFRATAINNFGQDGPRVSAVFSTSSCLSVNISTSGTSSAGGMLTIQANASGPSGLTYEFDLDNDGTYDRTSSDDTVRVRYPSAYDADIRVRVSDGGGGSTIASKRILIQAPHLSITSVGTPAQVCGDGDSAFDPGERWTLPVRITNDGPIAESGGYATFSPTDIVTGIPPVTTAETHVIMDTPAIPVGNLAPGASIDANVSFILAENSPCGARYTLQFTGGADSAAYSAGVVPPIATFNLAGTCQVTTTCPKAKAIAPPRQGLFYTPSRSGNGLSNFLIPGAGGSQVFFGAWFTANSDRSPTWYIVQGGLLGAAVKAPILKFTRDLGSPTFKATSAEVGRAVIAMIDAEHMVMTWTMGNKGGAEVMEFFTPGPAPSPNRTGAWYNPSESGWGEVIHQFNAGGVPTTFAVDYIYDAGAQPRWVIIQDTTANVATGTSAKTFQVHCPGCPWLSDWNEIPLASGTASVVFTGALTGTASTNLTLPAPLSGTWIRNNLPIQLLSTPQ